MKKILLMFVVILVGASIVIHAVKEANKEAIFGRIRV